jgi:vitamin K-dependent gamma-carboxylase
VSARPGAPTDVPWLALAWLRFQFGAVYFFAGVAKLIPDWLLHAQPLRLWLERHAGVPVVGPWLAWDPTAYLMSWAGCAFDLAVPFALLHPRTRLPAWAVLVIFHIATGVLFQIGVFPFVMVVGSTLFFDPSWPRRWLTAPGASVDAVVPSTTPDDARVSPPAAPLPRATLAVAAIAAAAQIAFPLRTFAYDHNHLWTEQGFRFSWRVLLMEKSGEVTFKVVDRVSGRTRWVDPARDLTPYQAQMMATQPDMVLRYASWIAREEQAIGRDVAIYADSWASLNGRQAQRLIDPDVDLTRVTDDLGPRVWVTSFRDGAPP